MILVSIYQSRRLPSAGSNTKSPKLPPVQFGRGAHFGRDNCAGQSLAASSEELPSRTQGDNFTFCRSGVSQQPSRSAQPSHVRISGRLYHTRKNIAEAARGGRPTPGAERPRSFETAYFTSYLTSLLNFHARASVYEFLLNGRRLVLGHAFFYRLGRAVHQVLGFFQAQAGDFTNRLNHVDLVGARGR